MLSEQFISELGIVLQAHNHLLEELQKTLSDVELSLNQSAQKLSKTRENTSKLQELEALMAELEAEEEWLEEEDFEDFDPDEFLQIYQNQQQTVFRKLTKIGFRDWGGFVRRCATYELSKGFNPLAPYESLLTEKDLRLLESESYEAQYKWDKTDYIFVGVAGILATLADFFLVGIPKGFVSGRYAGQQASPITTWLKKYDIKNSNDWFANWAKSLEKSCKVPYDRMNFINAEGEVKKISGMAGNVHRLQSLGHDPILGFVFGVLDIMRGTITGFSYDKHLKKHEFTHGAVWSNREPVNLIEALLLHMGHLISDGATPMGLPAPFMGLIQGINIGGFGEKEKSVGEIARWMYLNGYDFRHFLVSGLTPAVIEIILRAYIMLRHYSEHGEIGWDEVTVFNHPKYRSMLLMAHSIATMGNVGKITLMHGNPLAINYAEWMALFGYLIPHVKYLCFDKHRLKIEHLEKINKSGWDELMQSNDRLLTKINQDPDKSFTQIDLGVSI